MPTQPPIDDNRTKVQVRVLAQDRAGLAEAAKEEAAAFFGVDASAATLELGGMAARPHIRASDGRVVTYVAEVWVYYKPEVVATPIPRATVPARSRPAASAGAVREVPSDDDDPDAYDEDEIDDDADFDDSPE